MIGNESYVFAGLMNPVFSKSGDTVTADVPGAVSDQRTGMTQVSQFTLHLRQVEGIGKSVVNIRKTHRPMGGWFPFLSVIADFTVLITGYRHSEFFPAA